MQPRVRWLVVALVLAIVFVGSVTIGYVLAIMPGGIDSRCVSAGPAPTSLGPGWEPFEATTVAGSVQWMPFGRVCTWTAAAGAPAIAVGPGADAWPLTIVIWVSLMGAIAVALVSVVQQIRIRNTKVI